jgi:hypothetical protein
VRKTSEPARWKIQWGSIVLLVMTLEPFAVVRLPSESGPQSACGDCNTLSPPTAEYVYGTPCSTRREPSGSVGTELRRPAVTLFCD